MVFDFLKGQFVDVIHYVADTRDTMVWRFERQGHAINYGAKLTVREGQAAVFIHEGQLADVFGPGLYMLETNNLPVLTALQHWDHGFRSPFKSEVYFRNPIITRDPEFGPIRLRAFGTFTLRVTDPGRFMTEIVGTDGEFTTEEISVHIRDVIVQEFSRVIASSNIPVLDMAANTKDLGTMVSKAIAPATPPATTKTRRCPRPTAHRLPVAADGVDCHTQAVDPFIVNPAPLVASEPQHLAQDRLDPISLRRQPHH